MKIIEILGGKGPLYLPVSNEEQSLIVKIKEYNGLDMKKLEDRDRRLVDLLLRRDILYIKDSIVYFNKLTGPEF